uniref:Uncharacterized protein isoform X2 n=1 Tax=Nicotiana tabacum TaxID=4097 RepID=A0A1S4AZ20_TOBAC|nr:PREDICTED: uncharacterized protein LOC107802725 isoform X2 [Nicotiana tabacum]
MDCWSAENATNAFLKTLKMGERGKAPDVTEFISAMAAGNNAQLMVMACSGHPGSALLGLVAAAHQTGGRVICILRRQQDMHAAKKALLGDYANFVEFVIGEDVKTLLKVKRLLVVRGATGLLRLMNAAGKNMFIGSVLLLLDTRI